MNVLSRIREGRRHLPAAFVANVTQITKPMSMPSHLTKGYTQQPQ
jgi:hypothetical protein